MASYSKVKILDVIEDTTQSYDENGDPVKGKRDSRIRAFVVPVKPDPVYVNLTAAGDEIINTFRALKNHVVLFPSRAGVTATGVVYLSLGQGITVDDIDLIPDKLSKSDSIKPDLKPLSPNK